MALSLMNALLSREQAKISYRCEQAVFVILEPVKLLFIFQKKNCKTFLKIKTKNFCRIFIRAREVLHGISFLLIWVCKVVARCAFRLASPQILLMSTALCSLRKPFSIVFRLKATCNQGYIADNGSK